MALAVKKLCRFCARNYSFAKDLNEADTIFKFIKDFVRFEEESKLPMKMCLDCEEKILSFQMFILECSRAQETLKQMILEENTTTNTKVEELNTLEIAVKSEVKIELDEDEDIMDEDASSEQNYNDSIEDVKSGTTSPVKRKPFERRKLMHRPVSKEDEEKLNELLMQPKPQSKDFVKLLCHICNEEAATWKILKNHFLTQHKISPYVYCICGVPITSNTLIYSHVASHKLEYKRQCIRNESGLEDDKYADLKVGNFVSFRCIQCGKKFPSWYKLRAHSVSSHRKTPVVQCVCGYSIKSKSVLYKHIADHKNPNKLSCDKCMKVTKSAEALEKHKLKHIPKEERIFKCNDCDKVFNNKEALKSHTKSHIPIDERKVYECETCGLKFTTRSSALSHRRVVHEKIKSYICDLCGYSCSTNGELKQHRAIHSDDKPFVCQTCSKPFKTYSNLKTHMDTHDETSYACYICNRVLNSRRTLRKHLLVHDEKCRHVCSYCNKAFKRRQTLKVHLYTHTGDKPLSCQWCEERFAYASTLRSHRLRCHPDKMTQQPATTDYTYKNIYDVDIVKNEGIVLSFPKPDVDIATTLLK